MENKYDSILGEVVQNPFLLVYKCKTEHYAKLMMWITIRFIFLEIKLYLFKEMKDLHDEQMGRNIII